jgi:hypothetical protein
MRKEKPKQKESEPLVVEMACEGCGIRGFAGKEINPWNIARKVTKWLCRPCKSR